MKHKESIFWDVTRCSVVKSLVSEGTYYFHLKGGRVNQSSNEKGKENL
jgi:hypothetical protein